MSPRRLAPVVAVVAAASTAVLCLPASSIARPASPTRTCGVPRHFSGSGARSLGSLTLLRDTTLSWTSRGPVFQIISRDGVPVNSSDHHGTAEIGKGRMRQIQVSAMGAWRITFTPRCAPLASPSRYSGSGGKILPTLRVPRDSVLTWTSAGGTFQVITDDVFPVNSTSRHGTAPLPAGTYGRFIVNASGAWTLTIKAS